MAAAAVVGLACLLEEGRVAHLPREIVILPLDDILRGNSDDLGRTGRGLLVNKGFGFCRIFGPAVFVF